MSSGWRDGGQEGFCLQRKRLLTPTLVLLQLQDKWERSHFPIETNDIKHTFIIFSLYSSIFGCYMPQSSFFSHHTQGSYRCHCSGGAGVTFVLITMSRFVGLTFTVLSEKVSRSLGILESMSCVPATFLHDNVSCYFENVCRFSKAPPAIRCKSPAWTSCFLFNVTTV